jgi:hypothetical protein
MAENEPNAPPPEKGAAENAAPAAKAATTPEPVVPPNWGANMLLYGDVSRMLFRMHRNVAAHMDAHKRLVERMQSVFTHEQALVLELAKLIDENMALAQRKSNEDKTPPAGDSIDKIFDHAGNAMKETGRMLTEIQLEALALIEHYVKESTESGAKPLAKPEATKGSGKE